MQPQPPDLSVVPTLKPGPFHLSTPSPGPPAYADSTVIQLADAARGAGRMPTMGRAVTLDVFARDASPDVIGRAFVSDRDRPAVRHALAAAAAAYTDIVVRNSTLSINGAFPNRDGVVADVFFYGSEEPADLTWTNIFDVRDYRATREEDFELVDINNATSFRTYVDGEQIELTGVSGTLAKFPFSTVAGGFQYSWTWEQDEKFWRVADGLRSMNVNYAQNMARTAWAVATASAGMVSQTRDTTGATVVEKDINTINAACVAMLAALRASGRAVPSQPVFYLAYNSLTQGYPDRVAAQQAANYGLANATLGAAKLAFTVVPLASPEIPTGGLYLFLAKGKFKSGVRLDLTTWERFEPLNLTNARVGAGRYTHVRGDANQVRFIPLS